MEAIRTVSNKGFLFLCYLLHIVDTAQRIFRRAKMRLLSGSVIGPCNKAVNIRTTLYVFRIHATRLYKHVY